MNLLEKPILSADVTLLSIGCTVYGFENLQLQQGEKVKIKLNLAPSADIKKIDWLTTNDPVLDVDDHNDYALITASQIGDSRIELEIKKQKIHTILISVIKKQIISTKGEIVFTKPA